MTYTFFKTKLVRLIQIRWKQYYFQGVIHCHADITKCDRHVPTEWFNSTLTRRNLDLWISKLFVRLAESETRHKIVSGENKQRDGNRTTIWSRYFSQILQKKNVFLLNVARREVYKCCYDYVSRQSRGNKSQGALKVGALEFRTARESPRLPCCVPRPQKFKSEVDFQMSIIIYRVN